MEFGIIHTAENIALCRLGTGRTVLIERDSGDVRIENEQHLFEAKYYGVVGLLKFPESTYLALVSGIEKVGTLNGQDLMKIRDIECVPLGTNRNQRLAGIIKELLTQGFYFSSKLDLTNSIYNPSGRIREEYFWNEYVMKDFIDIEASEYILPIINGFVQITDMSENDEDISFGLISRREKYNCGPRYWSRGLDSQGYAANFVETEQILIKDSIVTFQQIRGSVPLIWNQFPTLKYIPTVRFGDSREPSERHIKLLNSKYGQVVYLNLISNKKQEGRLNEKYTELMKGNPDYIWFNFNQECKGTDYSKISSLISSLDEKYEGIFQSNDGQNTQNGTIRTNCLDCLDRTNLIQSYIGREAIKNYIDLTEKTESAFRIVWANNGDALSLFYAGSPAVKGEYTRYGKRTLKGFLADGSYSIRRYCLNNFVNGYHKNSRDLFLGHLSHEKMNRIPWKYSKLCLSSIGLCAGAVGSYYIASNTTDRRKYWGFLGISIGTSLLSFRILGGIFISRPLIY